MELPKVPDVAEQSCPPTQVQPPAQWSNIMMMRRSMIMMMRRRRRVARFMLNHDDDAMMTTIVRSMITVKMNNTITFSNFDMIIYNRLTYPIW